MRKVRYIPFVLLILILIIASVCVPHKVFATSGEDKTYPTPPTLLDRIQIDDEMYSTTLFRRLCDVYNTYYGLEKENKLDEVYSNMFSGMDFAVFDGVLNLASKGNSSSGITAITGLERLDFSECINLKKVDLSNNAILTINVQDLSSLKQITELDISDNDITSANLSELNELQILDASDNNLSGIDLSFMKAETDDCYINLSGNNITDVNKVYFRRAELLEHNVNLSIVNGLQIDEYSGNAKVVVNSGIVGLKNAKYYKGNKLIYNKITDLSRLKISSSDIKLVIKDYDSLTEKYSLTNSSVAQSINILDNLAYGKYIMYFADSAGGNIYSQNSVFKDQYNAITIEYMPSTPELIVKRGDEVLDFASGDVLTEDVVVHISVDDTNAIVMYKIDDNDWTEGSEINISAGKSTILQCKVIVGGYESGVVIYHFNEDKSFSFNDVLGIILIIIAFCGLVFGLLPLVRYFINKPIRLNSDKGKDKKDE